MGLCEDYLRDLMEIRSSGAAVKETSYYPVLATLLNAAGRDLKPRVRCVMTTQNVGAGIPDIGLFTAEQFQQAGAVHPLPGQKPARGVVEVKSTGDDVWLTADGPQVTRYWGAYHQVLVTNYRDFLLVGRDDEGHQAKLESFRFAASEHAFHLAALNPRKMEKEQGERFEAFLKRALTHSAPLSTPADLAWLLASYAREALARVEAAATLPALTSLRGALEQALGLTFSGAKGEHFFRSSLVQTLFYGIFAAWVLWSRRHLPASQARFDWHGAVWELRVPMIHSLFQQLAQPMHLEPMRLEEVLDWAGAALNRVDRASFFANWNDGQAVQYFYEPFLKAFDPRLRDELGVWYTPHEIVDYMVERVDAVLRTDLGVADGLADPSVYVLDPCCGTGAYLVSVLNRIQRTLRAKGDDALLAYDVKRAAQGRVFGFEILPAPFVVSHLQIGLLLQSLGAPLSDAQHERAGVYLTNALTGWGQAAAPQQQLPLPGLDEEREAAGRVKRRTPILVVLGNPPYNGFAGVGMAEERTLSNAYRSTVLAPAPQGQGLNDLYVRFFRMAERCIVEKTGKGVVCFISNYSWLDGLSFTGMREHFMDVFDTITIDCLNGDKYKTGKLTPDGHPDPSVFSTDWHPVGIQVGTAIALLVRNEQHAGTAALRFRHLWGKDKRAQLADEAEHGSTGVYDAVTPPLALGLPFVPARHAAAYATWPLLPDVFPVSFPGVKTSRDDFLVDIDRDRLEARLRRYFDPGVSNEEIAREYPAAMQSTQRFNAVTTRGILANRGLLSEKIVRYCYRPFDVRWLYWEPNTKLLDEKRREYFPHVFRGNHWLEARQRQPMEHFDRGYHVSVLADNFGNGLSSYYPLFLHAATGQASYLSEQRPAGPVANLTDEATYYLGLRGATEPDAFFHVVASLRSPAYAEENAGGLRQDWPRVPLPATREALLASAALGREVAALLDPEQAVPGVTAGALRPELAGLGRLARIGGGSLQPATELALTAGWGYAGQGGVTMPGGGRVKERPYEPDEEAALAAGAASLGLSAEEARGLLGETTLDVYLNDVAYWRNVPAKVWRYTIGGYQVLKKWLSYREQELLGRPLRPEEAREASAIARRIAALLLLGPRLDANYARVKADTYPWPRK